MNTHSDRELVLTFAALESLVHNPALQAELPFVRYAFRRWNSVNGGRSCCGKRNKDTSMKQYLAATVRDGLMTLDPTRIKKVKSLLGVNRLVGIFDGAHGKTRKEI